MMWDAVDTTASVEADVRGTAGGTEGAARAGGVARWIDMLMLRAYRMPTANRYTKRGGTANRTSPRFCQTPPLLSRPAAFGHSPWVFNREARFDGATTGER